MMNLGKFKDALDPKNHYRYLGREERDLILKCNQIVREIKAKKPGLRGWLAGGVNTEGMLEVKRQIEGEDHDKL